MEINAIRILPDPDAKRRRVHVTLPQELVSTLDRAKSAYQEATPEVFSTRSRAIETAIRLLLQVWPSLLDNRA